MAKICAEIGLNHGGDYAKAIEMIRVAAECGVSMVKFQFFHVDILCLNRNDFSNYELLKRICPKPSWLPLLKQECDRRHVDFSCTAFCEYSAEDISPYIRSFKVASPEATNIPFLKKLSKYGKPMILSTGKSTQIGLDDVMDSLSDTGVGISLLYCVSKYPALPTDYSLSELDRLAKRYNCKVGLSDHTQGLSVSLEAAKLGAFMIERHFKLDNNCVDSKVSLTPSQLKKMCDIIKQERRLDYAK